MLLGKDKNLKNLKLLNLISKYQQGWPIYCIKLFLFYVFKILYKYNVINLQKKNKVGDLDYLGMVYYVGI